MSNNMNDEDIVVIKNPDGTEKLLFDPYNPLNITINEKDIQNILKKYNINIPIHNYNLFRRAFIHRSYTKRPDEENKLNNIEIAEKPTDCLPLSTKSNERLEFLGDGILECVTKYYLYRRFPKENEGFMTEKKIVLVKNESIGRLAYDMGLHKWLIMSKHAESKQTRTNIKKLGCLFEAFIGALFLDANKIEINDDNWYSDMFVTGPGFQVVQKFVENVFETHVDWISLVNIDENFKNLLQVVIQKEFKVTPHYMEIEDYHNESGYHTGVYLCLGQSPHNLKHNDAQHINTFKSFQDIHDIMAEKNKIFIFLGEGLHKIKKKAEQISCKDAIEVLKNYT